MSDRREKSQTFAESISDRSSPRWLVFSGDWGGQIYATVPVSMLCDITKVEIAALLRDLDQGAWASNNLEGADAWVVDLEGPMCGSVADFIPRLEGWRSLCAIEGGMGGGEFLEGEMWFHDEFLKKGVEEINRLRALLRLSPLETFEFIAGDDDDDNFA